MKYYDLVGNWPKVKPHLEDDNVKTVLHREFHKFAMSALGTPFSGIPKDYEIFRGWREDRPKPHPEYWDYVCSTACAPLANFSLALAMASEPETPWRIIHSEEHNSVWDGNETLFDFNRQAFGISADECFREASRFRLDPGRFLYITSMYVSHDREWIIDEVIRELGYWDDAGGAQDFPVWVTTPRL